MVISDTPLTSIKSVEQLTISVLNLTMASFPSVTFSLTMHESGEFRFLLVVIAKAPTSPEKSRPQLPYTVTLFSKYFIHAILRDLWIIINIRNIITFFQRQNHRNLSVFMYLTFSFFFFLNDFFSTWILKIVKFHQMSKNYFLPVKNNDPKQKNRMNGASLVNFPYIFKVTNVRDLYLILSTRR